MKFQTAKNGFYVVLEGVDTCGKSTQIENLKTSFLNAVFTKEPGGSSLGECVREILLDSKNIQPLSEFFLFLADRNQHYCEVLRPNLESGKLVISDRSFISGLAYMRDMSVKEALEFNFIALQGLKPNASVLLEVSEEDLRTRLNQKPNDRIEQRGIPYMLETQSKMLHFLQLLEIPTLKIQASLPQEQITQQITNFIQTKL